MLKLQICQWIGIQHPYGFAPHVFENNLILLNSKKVSSFPILLTTHFPHKTQKGDSIYYIYTIKNFPQNHQQTFEVGYNQILDHQFEL